MSEEKCPICRCVLQAQPENLAWESSSLYVTNCRCNRCGTFHITEDALEEIRNNGGLRLAVIIWEKKLQGLKPFVLFASEELKPAREIARPIFTVKELLELFPRTPMERLDRALLNLNRRAKHLGDAIQVEHTDYPLLFAEHGVEAQFILRTLHEKGYIREEHENLSGRTDIARLSSLPIKIVIVEKGLARIYDLETERPGSKQAFVAMWFPKEEDEKYKFLNEAYRSGLEKAIRDSGYLPLRIDRKEFIGRIDDEIIAQIRRSRFMVADFTGHRAGVYYEAGFAHGLSIPVIYTCYKDDIDNAHFDTRQQNHIVWKDYQDLYIRLLNRLGSLAL